MKKVLITLLLVLSLGCITNAVNVDPDLMAKVMDDSVKSVEVIVTMLPDKPHVDVSQFGGYVERKYSLINGFLAVLSTNAVESLMKEPDVKSLTLNKSYQAMLNVATPTVKADWLWTANPGLTGQGVTIAIIDTGICPLWNFQNRIIGWIDYVNGTTMPYDDNGHGTYVAGCAAGNDPIYKGPAYEAYLLGVKVLNAQGSGNLADIISGIEWAANRGADVINLSLGRYATQSAEDDPLCQACAAAWDDGVVVVVSTGSTGVSSPANERDVITVTLSDDNGTITILDDTVSGTIIGPSDYDYYIKPDVVAPGVNITAIGCNGYMTATGSSASAAIVSGVVAQLIEGVTNVPQKIKNKLMLTSHELIDVTYKRFIEGEGLIDAWGAYNF